MDGRSALPIGAILPFPGMACEIVRESGRGSNAIVYEAAYRDAAGAGIHRVLVKELFPYDAEGRIRRVQGDITVDPDAAALFARHRDSFLRGNALYLDLLAGAPDQAGGNLNTYALNGTLYTLLGDQGGRSLQDELALGGLSLRDVARRMTSLLHTLSAFHSRGLLHLDISPENVILVGPPGHQRVLLIDYNSAHTASELASAGDVYIGTKPGYTAPEAASGRLGDVGPWTDLFCVACIFHALLTGAPPTPVQLSLRRPPDAAGSPLLAGMPATVREQAARILRRGLCAVTRRRYQTCRAMIDDFDELVRRLDGVGITHAALFESGRRSADRLVRSNPALAYLRGGARLYPLCVSCGGQSLPIADWLAHVQRSGSVLLTGEGGSGKSTALLCAALGGGPDYAPARPAMLYLPLTGTRRDAKTPIADAILAGLRFSPETATMADARHALTALLSAPIMAKSGPVPQVVLLLDGLNELPGDLSALIDEIRALAALPGVCIVLAGRTPPDGLALPVARMAPLSDEAVAAALAANGLLAPESPELARLLHSPMMLSLFVQTALAQGAQVLCRTQGELIDRYLSALCAKPGADDPEHHAVAAAVCLVLPAIAARQIACGGPLDRAHLLPVVRRCFMVVRSPALLRAFPAFIGHRAQILCGCEDAERWFGAVVDGLLHRRLGLLVRDEAGRFSVGHQLLRDHLARMHEANARALVSRRMRAAALAALAVLPVVAAALLVYQLCFAPVPADALAAEIVFDAAHAQYLALGSQYDAMDSMLSGAITPEACISALCEIQTEPQRADQLVYDRLRAQTTERTVVPWSGLPFDYEAIDVLFALPAARHAQYVALCRAMDAMRSGESAADQAKFADAVLSAVRADADCAWLLSERAIAPHRAAMQDRQAVYAEYADSQVPAIQRASHVDVSAGIDAAERTAQRAQADAHSALLAFAPMHDPDIRALYDEGAQMKPRTPLPIPEPSGADEAGRAMMAAQAVSMDIQERAFAAAMGAHRSLADFAASNDYADLVAARLAADEALAALDACAADAQTAIPGLTDAQVLALLDLDINAATAANTAQEAIDEIDFLAAHVTYVKSLLWFDAYSDILFPALADTAAAHMRFDAISAALLPIRLNLLLLPIADDEAARALWASMPARWPTLAEGAVWHGATAEAELALFDALFGEDSYTTLLRALDETLGAGKYAVEAAGDAHTAHVIDGMPALVPLPRIDTFDFNQATLSSSQPGGDAPAQLTLSGSASLEAIEFYVSDLMVEGLELANYDPHADGSATFTFTLGSEAVVLEYDADGAFRIAYDPAAVSLERYDYIRLAEDTSDT